jgi:hypothetical protein
MKKLILAAVAAFSITASAADLRSVALLNAQSVLLTNTIQVTNLIGATITTNVQGTIYTNLAGTRVIVSAAGAGASQNLLGGASLPPILLTPNVNTNGTLTSGGWQPTYANFSAKIKASSGANSAVTFTFVPVPDGANALTAVGNELSVSFTATASSTIVVSTNVPIVDWPGPYNLSGCQGIRLKRIVNADTDASSDVYVSDVYLNYIVP